VRAPAAKTTRMVRNLARAWIYMIWRCWQVGAAYDPAKHNALQAILDHQLHQMHHSSGKRDDGVVGDVGWRLSADRRRSLSCHVRTEARRARARHPPCRPTEMRHRTTDLVG